MERPSRSKQFDTGSLNHHPRPLAWTTLLWWLGCKWKIQLEFPLQNGDLIYRTYLCLHFFTELHLHMLRQVTKEGKCSLDTLEFKVSQKTCPSRSNAAFPPCHGSPTSPMLVLESRKRGKEIFHWECGDWEILFLSSFLFLTKDSCNQFSRQSIITSQKNWEFCKYFPSDVAVGYLCT